ncbi:MAG: class I SAM-dependent methyltransferase [Gammaproteobacteria bacterium]|nr:class I SAM-dependent methyltransferase [Gammaproteobacteria bacterium]
MIVNFISLAEAGKVPDFLLRYGIRRLCRQRLRDECADNVEAQQRVFQERIEQLRASPIAIETEAANEQHYEVPAEFYRYALGEHLKYSACFYPTGDETLSQAEAAMLALYCQRAELQDGQKVLELGCGWGSLTLWMAEHYPNSQITGVSNSVSQRGYILEQAAQRGLENIEIQTCDVNKLTLPASQYDRVISIEMFEHMRNYRQLMENIAAWLTPQGKLFVHIFVHRVVMYPFDIQGEDDWMSRYFFTGGLMPAADTLLHFQQHLTMEQRWLLDGRHYEKTSNHWLANMDAHQGEIMQLFKTTYGAADANMWFHRWRIFFLACAELFGLDDGQQWMVAHYLFSSRGAERES